MYKILKWLENKDVIGEWDFELNWISCGLSPNIDGLVQERRNSSALAMELRLSCTTPSLYWCKLSPWFPAIQTYVYLCGVDIAHTVPSYCRKRRVSVNAMRRLLVVMVYLCHDNKHDSGKWLIHGIQNHKDNTILPTGLNWDQDMDN